MRSILKGHHIIWIAAILIAFIVVPMGPYSWAGWEHFDPNNMSILPSSQINSLVKDPNRLWIGTDAGLVSVMLGDPNTWEDHPEVDANYIPITSMAMDQDGILWLGTPKGLVSYDPNLVEHPGLEFDDADQIVDIVANPNYVWVATDRGVNQFDKSSSWTLYRNDPNGFDPNTAIGLASSEDDVIWVLPGAPFPFGAYRYIVSSDQWDWFPEDIFTTLVMGDSNDIWFGSPGSGLFRFQPDPNIWTQWQAALYELPSNTIQAIGMEQGSNRIIVATTNGLARYDLNQVPPLWQPIGPPASIDIENQKITEILMDANHNQVWFGTEGGGLYRWVEGAVIWSSPVNGIEDVPLDINTIDVVFSERIDPNTVILGGAGSNVTLTMLDPNNNPITVDPNNFTLYFYDPLYNTHLIIEPLNDLYPNTLYKFRFTTNITNYAGVPIKIVDSELLFKTVIPPGVVDTVPDPNAIDVIPHEPVEIVFSKSMDPNSFFPNMLTFNSGGLPTSISEGETSFPDPNHLVINVSGGLDTNTKYTFIVSRNVTDIAGNKLLADFQFSFTTKSAPQIQFQPGSPDPGDGDINVSLDTNIAVSFDTAMDTASVEAHFTIDPNVTGTFSWINGDERLIFTPDTELASSTTYTVTIDANAKDTDGIPIGITQSWSFTTEVDTTPPSIISVFPVEDEASASIYTKIKVTFDMAMDTGSVESAFSLKDASQNDIFGSFQWSGAQTEFQFDPNGLLDPNMTYTASVSNAAVSAAGGFALDPNKTWQFTTVLPQTFTEPVGGWPKLDIMGMDPNTTAITALAFDPNDGGLWAGIALIDPNSKWTGQGIYHYNGAEWTSYGTGVLSSNAITDIVIDRQGNVWVATEPDPNGGGVYMFDGQDWHHYSPAIDPNQFFIKNRGSLTPAEIQDFFQVNAIGVYNTGLEDLIWIATTGGIAVGRYDSGFGDWKWSATADHRLLYMLAIDHVTDTIWFESGDPFWNPNSPCAAIAGLGADDFIQRFGQWPDVWDPNDMVWKPNGGLPKMRFLGEIRPNLRAMTADGSHNLWLATKDGLYKISMDSLILGSCDYEIYGIVETGGGLLSDNILDVILNPDDPNKLWVNTDAGISVYDLTKPIESPASWIRYPLTGIQVLVMLPIPNGGVLTGTEKGLNAIGDHVSPTVTDSYPADQATGVPVGEDYWVSFSELMDPNVTKAAFSFTDASSTPVPGVLSWEGRTLKFTPSNFLSQSTQYSMQVDTTAKDLAGNSLSQAFQADFTTTGSWVSSVVRNQNAITVKFILPMDPNSITSIKAFCLKIDPNTGYGPGTCMEGDLEWSGNQEFTFTPSEPLEEGFWYILTIDTTATDINGIHMPEAFMIRFQMASTPSVLKFTGIGCFIRSVEEDGIGILDRIKMWLNMVRKPHVGFEP